MNDKACKSLDNAVNDLRGFIEKLPNDHIIREHADAAFIKLDNARDALEKGIT